LKNSPAASRIASAAYNAVMVPHTKEVY